MSTRSADPHAPRPRLSPSFSGLALAGLLASAGCADEAPAGPPTIAIADVSVVEGDDPAHPDASLTVTLSRAAPVDVAGTLQLASTSATDGVDYDDVELPFVIPAGQLTVEVPLPILGDLRHEPTETLDVVLEDVTEVEVLQGSATVTILDDDPATTISVTDAAIDENNPAGGMEFVVSLAEASPDTVTVDYATVDGTAHAGSDYTQTAGVLSFAPGETTQTVWVPVLDDVTYEGGVHAFTLALTNPVGNAATFGDASGTGSIGDDEAMPTLEIVGDSPTEGTSVETVGRFYVTLSHPSEATVTADYATEARGAVAPDDFAATSGTLTLLPGETEATLSVPLVSDDVPELDDDFGLVLSNLTNAIGGVTTGSLTIVNDDFPTVTVEDASGTELDGTQLGSISFVFRLSQPAPFLVRVGYAVVFGPTSTATSSDVVQVSGTRGFPAGTTMNTFVLGIRPDALTEPSETFDLVLSNPENAILGTTAVVGTILDDD